MRIGKSLKFILPPAAWLVVVLSGCSHGNNGISAVGGDDANALNAQHSRFEQESDPDLTAQTRFAAGQLAESNGNIPAAIEQYHQALKVDPNQTASLYRLAVLQTRQKQFGEAVTTWETYLSATNDPAGYANIGFCWDLAGRPEKAEAAYKKGIEADGTNEACRVNYGLFLARAGRGNEALLQLQTVLSPAEAHYNLGSIYEMQSKKDEARVEYRKSLEMNPALGSAKTRLAAIE